LNNSRVSKLKVENVLKPPQNPIATKFRIKLSPSTFAPIYNRNTPKTRHAKILESKVANGKDDPA
jgi:hypothetical protein